LDLDKVLACYAADYANDRDGFWTERLKSDRDGVRVHEWRLEEERPFSRADIKKQLNRYFADKRSIEESKFKLSFIEDTSSPEEMIVRAILWLRGTTKAGQAFECQAQFRLRLVQSNNLWKIQRQELIYGETVTGDRTGFTDITAAAGIDFRAQHNPLFATPEWEPKMMPVVKYGSAGVAVADYDNDGWYDIFFCDGKQPRLYR